MTNLIEEVNVTAVNLSVELERAVIQHELQDEVSIYVTEDGFFPFWIRILKDRGFIELSTYTFFKKSSTPQQRSEFCNKINCRYYMITACTNNGKLKIDHVMNFRDGLLRESFIRGCRQFSRTIETAMLELDPENDIVLPPGKTESENVESE